MLRRPNLTLTTSIILTAVLAPAQTTAKPPWSWTDDERARERLDPQARRDRLAAYKSSGRVRNAAPGFTPIDGKRNPELFYPHELMDELLRHLDVPVAQLARQREDYRKEIEAAGLDYDSFWRTIEPHATTFNAVWRQMGELQRLSRGHGPEQSQWKELAQELCIARVTALATAQSRFGVERFNRFLYAAIAPRLTYWVSDEENAQSLRRPERERCVHD